MRPSWDLKLDRAEHHLGELNREIDRLADGDQYEAVEIASTRRKGNIRRYRLNFTRKPDEMIPIIVGDIVHNVRSSLDHVAVSLVPARRRGMAGFPIFTTCPYDADGNAFNNELGKAWAKLTTGIPNGALAVIKMVQPFQPPDDETVAFCKEWGVEPDDINGLAALSRFDNADKHRKPITVLGGLENPTLRFSENGVPQMERTFAPYFMEDGTEFPAIDFSAHPNAEVDVKVTGTVRIAMEVRRERGVLRLPTTLEKLVEHVRAIADVLPDAAAGTS